MQTSRYNYKQIILRFALLFIIVSILISCQLNPSANATSTSTSAPTEQIATVTSPPLPEIFQSAFLNPVDKPHTYVEQTCRYLRSKWNPLNAEPGTVVMIILFKNINRGTAELPDSISMVDFLELMNQLQVQGFEAINTEQLQAFMERNVKIPPRSVLLIQDGNHGTEYYDSNFGEPFSQWGWGVVNGWVSERDVDQTLLNENIEMERNGFIDHQARGITSDTYLSDDIGKTVIARELQGSVNGFAAQFQKNPIAIIWPNGGFGIRPVEAARQLHFKLGFTSNSRGPIMYNWVPLADSPDPDRPDMLPEGPVNDPLMTLPVYSPNEALIAIDAVRTIGKNAGEYALSNKETEYKYYETVCEEEFGPMPTP
ncbi:MAG: hypothetical protein H6634_12080 [Anaerolineales bacterium]|nr:hypothetical protein [Anaerolineales bacterium]